MKRWFIIAVLASVLLLAGGSGAATLDTVPPNIILKDGEVVRLGNTAEVCRSLRVGVTFGRQPKRMAPAIVCYPSKTGEPVVGTHANLAMWVKGPNGKDDLVPAIGRWFRLKGIKGITISKMTYWPFPNWASAPNLDFISFSPEKVRKKVKIRGVTTWDLFAPKGAERDFACYFQTTTEDPVVPKGAPTAGCDYQRHLIPTVYLSIRFWAPWGSGNVEVWARDTNPDCINSEGTRGCGPVRWYPQP